MSSDILQQLRRRLHPRTRNGDRNWIHGHENGYDDGEAGESFRGLEIQAFQWNRPRYTVGLFSHTIIHLDITPNTVTLAKFRKYMNHIYPVEYQTVELDSSRDDSLRRFLEENVPQFQQLNPRYWVTLQHPAIQLMDIAIPRISEDIDIEKALSLQLKSEIPEFTEEDYFWQYHETGIIDLEGIPNLHFFITLIPKDILNQYLKIFEEFNIQPEFILPRSFVLLTGIENVVHNMHNAIVMEVSEKTTTIAAYFKDRAVKITELPWGFGSPAEHRGRFDIPFSEDDILSESFLKKRMERQKEEESLQVSPRYLPFLFELNRLQYFLHKELMISGMGAILVNLNHPQSLEFIGSLQNIFRAPVLPVFPMEREEQVDGKPFSFVLVGMPFYLKHHPHLIPKEIRWEERLKKVNVGLSVVFFVFISLLSLHYWGQQRQIQNLNSRVQQLQQTVVQIGKTNETLKNLLVKKNQLQWEVTSLQQLLQQQSPILPVMYRVTQQLPEGIIIDEILIDDSDNPMFIEYQSFVAADKWELGILLRGHSLLPVIAAESRLIDFVSRMKKTGIFKEIVPVNRNFNVTNQRYEFQMVLIVK